MAAEAAYLVVYHDIQATVSSLLVQVRQAAQESGSRELRVVEDHLFVIGTALQLVQDDITAESARLSELGEQLAGKMHECDALLEQVRQRENELRITGSIVRNYEPEQISVDEVAGVTVVRGAPKPVVPPPDNVLTFPDPLSRAARRLTSDREPGGAA